MSERERGADQEECVSLVGGQFIFSHATAAISSETIPDDDDGGDSDRFDDFHLTVHGYDDYVAPKTITLVIKSTDVETFAALLNAAATFYGNSRAEGRRAQ